MPGLAGIIASNRGEGLAESLDQMLESMKHEEFYQGNKYINTELGIYVGWMSQKGSFSDCMPVIDTERGVVLIFQGEHFSNSQDASPLSSQEDRKEFYDAQRLIDFYEGNVDSFLNKLNGWFCGVLVDLRSKTATLFNDRYNMSRVYFHEGKKEFLFASEAKAILKVRPILRTLEVEPLAQYLRFNCVMGERSLFKDIALLPPAAAWQFEGGDLAKKRNYFAFGEWERQSKLTNENFYEEFSQTIANVVPNYLGGSQKVGISLSAGLDTRVIMAAVADLGRKLTCYTFGGEWGELYDIRCARKIAAACEQDFDVIRIDEKFFADFANLARRSVYISDGIYDALGAHDVYFNQRAREIAPIRVTGKFGSEVVRERKLIPKFEYPEDLIDPDLRLVFDRLPSASCFNHSGEPLTKVVSEEIPWYEYGRVAIEQSQVTLRSPYMDNALVKLMYRAPSEARSAGKLQEQYVRDRCEKLTSIPTNMGIFASNNEMVGKVLYRALWALFKIEYIYLYATPHWMTRIDRSMERFNLERIFAGRQKWEGYRIWIKTRFPEFVRDTLLNPSAQYTRYFKAKTVHKMVSQHIAGTHNYLNEINKVLTVELIHTTLLRD